MRISTPLSQSLGINAMLDQQAKMAKTQVQMASGLRIVAPSDDPPAAVRALALKESIAVTDQFQVNVTMARSRLSQEESALDGLTTTLQRVYELSVRGANDSLNPSDRKSIAAEVDQLTEQVRDLMNAKNDGGESLFGGSVTSVKPFLFQPDATDPAKGVYTYQGDSNTHSTWIGPSYAITTTDPGNLSFNIDATPPLGVVPAPNIWDPVTGPDQPPPPAHARTWMAGSEPNILNVVMNFSQNMKDNWPDPQDIERLHRAMTKVDDIRVTVGGRLQALDNQENLNMKFIADEKGYLSITQDLDFTEAISRLNLQTSALQAAQQAYAKVEKLSLFNFL